MGDASATADDELHADAAGGGARCCGCTALIVVVVAARSRLYLRWCCLQRARWL